MSRKSLRIGKWCQYEEETLTNDSGVPDAQVPEEIIVICSFATRGRLQARLGRPACN
jgi:hypothetical protein